MITSKFISDILELLLDGDEEGIRAKPQMKYLSEADYNYTGVGVFINFNHNKDVEEYKSSKPNLILSGVVIKSSELNLGADATLFFRDGIIDYLEIWSYDGNYPKKELEDYILTQEWKGSPAKQRGRHSS